MSALLRLAARNLVRGQFDVRPGDGVLVTTDERTGKALVEALSGAIVDAGARPVIVVIPQLPFQGALADPYIPDSLSAAAAASDHWFDLCFPYLAGSSMHAAAMQAGRSRYALLATAGARSFARLYGGVDLDALLDYQVALVDYIDARAGEVARFICPLGSDLRFTLDRVKLRRERVARSPGMHTVPGAQSLYPVPKSVSGRLVLQALFDEHYRRLRRPIAVEVDGGISGFSGAAAEDAASFDRALRRAGGSGGYGGLIHFTLGFHPAARVTGRHFIEDIRALGSNAIGMGLPWWEAGGGENHPDGVVLDQSLWIGADLIVDAGRVVGPESLKDLHQRVARVFV
jgi:leucyl aminopeptidase (aminopeptidase T)